MHTANQRGFCYGNRVSGLLIANTGLLVHGLGDRQRLNVAVSDANDIASVKCAHVTTTAYTILVLNVAESGFDPSTIATVVIDVAES